MKREENVCTDIIALSPPGQLSSRSGSYTRSYQRRGQTSAADLVPWAVDIALRVVSSLMMKWDTVLSLVHLRNLRLRA